MSRDIAASYNIKILSKISEENSRSTTNYYTFYDGDAQLCLVCSRKNFTFSGDTMAVHE